MNVQSLLTEPGRVDEPCGVQEYSAILSQVVAEGKSVIVRRDGADLAAVVPLADLEAVREILAREQVEKLASQIDWDAVPVRSPPQEWLDDTDNPFEPEPVR